MDDLAFMWPNQKLTDRQIKSMKKMRPYNTKAELARFFDVDPSTVDRHCQGIEGPMRRQPMVDKGFYERPTKEYKPYIHNFYPPGHKKRKDAVKDKPVGAKGYQEVYEYTD